MTLELNSTNITLAILLITNLVGLVWGAAKINSSVNNLSIVTTRLDTTLSNVIEKQNDHDAEIRVLKNESKKNGDEILLARNRIHDLSAEVLQPLLIMIDKISTTVKGMTSSND